MQQRSGDLGKQMRVLVGIEMSDIDTRPLQLLHLRHGLPLDVVFSDITSQQRLYEVEQAGPERLAIAAQQSGNVIRVRDRDPVGKHNMATDPQPRVGHGDRHRIVKTPPRVAISVAEGKHPIPVQLTNGTVDARSETEIVALMMSREAMRSWSETELESTA